MPSKDQIKKEVFLSMLTKQYGPVINDIVIDNIVRLALTKKYQYHLDTEELQNIGDELVDDGYFRWNDNGKLTLTEHGLKYLSKFL